MIGYDALSAYGSPSYYAFQMFSQNVGDEILPTSFEGTAVQGCATLDRDKGEIILKLVNPNATEQNLSIDLKGITSVAPEGQAITLSGCPEDTNSIQHPRNVMPIKTTVRMVKSRFVYTMKPNSIVILKLKAQL